MKISLKMFGLLSFALLMCIPKNTMAQNNTINYNGQDLFLNGTNLAWINFANDIGTESVDFDRFGEVFKDIHDYGGNSVRLWLHTNGTTTPQFSNDTVTGPGTGAIDDLKQILDSAYKYDIGLILCLWSFDMLRKDIGEPFLTRNRKILEEDAALNSYIEYALKPIVDSTKDHPGIIAWEVINEPEGMIPDAFWGGWSEIEHVTRQDVQRLINRVAGAIHRISPDLQVTSGAHNMHSLSDKGDGNFYADTALIKVGGDTAGYLDFYQAHHYSFPLNPFEHNYNYWNIDKPLLIGEFHPGDVDLGDFSNYETLIDSGYAGAMGWMWLDSYSEKIKDEVQYLFLNRTSEVDIDNNIGDSPSLLFTGPEYGAILESGSNITFNAEAVDTDGTIEKVEFILDRELLPDTILYIDTEAPFEFTWTSPEDGTYGVYAKVNDNDGYLKQSKKILFTVGAPPRYRYEAEDADLEGDASAKSDEQASNGQYADFLEDGTITWTIPNCPAAGTYNMIIGYAVFYGEKNNYIVINGDDTSKIDWHFSGSANGWLRDTIAVELQEGVNTISIEKFWGWMQFDFIEFPFARIPYATNISVSTESGNDYIDEKYGTLQMIATIEPEEASYYSVEWSLNDHIPAIINEDGLLTGKEDGKVKAIATATDGSGVTGEMEITITNQTLGLIQNLSNNIKIYPNPVNDFLHYELAADVYQIEVYNMHGMLAKSFVADGVSGNLNFAEFEAGLYYIKFLYSNKSVGTSLFIKK